MNIFTKKEFEKIGNDNDYFEEFEKMEWPNPKTESWKYSKLELVGNSTFRGFDTKFKPRILAKNCTASFDERQFEWNPKDKFEAGIKAFAHCFVRIKVASNEKASVSLGFYPNASTAATVLVELGDGSELDYFEEFESDDKENFFGAKALFITGQSSTLHYCSIQNFGSNTASIINKEFKMGENSKMVIMQAELGSSFSRNVTIQQFEGRGSECVNNNAIIFGNKSQHFDLTTLSKHVASNTKNNILVKGGLNESSSAVYRGLISIEKDAFSTNSFLTDHMLHLSEKANSNSIPSLKIENNEVKASHSASISKVDKEDLFYLKSRGLKEKVAEELIIKGFANSIISGFPKQLRERLERKVIEKIEA